MQPQVFQAGCQAGVLIKHLRMAWLLTHAKNAYIIAQQPLLRLMFLEIQPKAIASSCCASCSPNSLLYAYHFTQHTWCIV